MPTVLPIKLTETQTRVLQLLAYRGMAQSGWTYGTQSNTNKIKRQLAQKGLLIERPLLGETYGLFEMTDIGFAVAVMGAVEAGINEKALSL